MSIPSSIRIVKQGSDRLKVIGLAALPKEDQAQVVEYIREHKQEILQAIEKALVPAKEFIEYARMGMARIHTDGKGGLWWSTKYQDGDSIEFLAGLWMEAYEELFQALYRGELDGLAIQTDKRR